MIQESCHKNVGGEKAPRQSDASTSGPTSTRACRRQTDQSCCWPLKSFWYMVRVPHRFGMRLDQASCACTTLQHATKSSYVLLTPRKVQTKNLMIFRQTRHRKRASVEDKSNARLTFAGVCALFMRALCQRSVRNFCDNRVSRRQIWHGTAELEGRIRWFIGVV